MQLNKSADPARSLTWNGKSLAVCSRKELIACIVYLGGQMAILQQQNKRLMGDLAAAMPVLEKLEQKSVEPVQKDIAP